MRGATHAIAEISKYALISTHTPHAGRNAFSWVPEFGTVEFQLTRPMRGATPCPGGSALRADPFQLTRPMRGATHAIAEISKYALISTHTPHAGRNAFSWVPEFGTVEFQLTRPMRGATPCPGGSALRADPFQLTRPMRGATYNIEDNKFYYLLFQLTRPMRGATYPQPPFLLAGKFQLTRPMRGATGRAVPPHNPS